MIIKQGQQKIMPTMRGSKLYPPMIKKENGCYNRLMCDKERKAWYIFYNKAGDIKSFIVFLGKDKKEWYAMGSYYSSAFDKSEAYYSGL